MSKSINEELFNKLNILAPLYLAEKWDNVGMLVEPEEEVKIKKIMLTNDLTIDVMKEVEMKGVQMIFSYHPPLFHGFKKLRRDNWKELVITKCVKLGLYVYSPHTAIDSVHGGVNDWLLSVFEMTHKSPVDIYKGELDEDSKTYYTGDKQIQHGGGRYGTLATPLPISTIIDLLKTHLKLDHLLLATSRHHSRESLVASIAVCAGSGSSVLKSCSQHVDLWITGEMSHHDLLDVTEHGDGGRGTSVILTSGHSNSERGFLTDVLKPRLMNQLSGVEVLVSEADSDPLTTV